MKQIDQYTDSIEDVRKWRDEQERNRNKPPLVDSPTPSKRPRDEIDDLIDLCGAYPDLCRSVVNQDLFPRLRRKPCD